MAADWIRAAGRVALRPQARRNAVHEWRRRRRGEPAVPTPVRNVLVLCKGNICRSPFAEMLLAARCPALTVRSGGLWAAQGNPADPSALRVARRFGVDLTAHRTHSVVPADLDWADWVLGMEGYHVVELRRRWPGATAPADSLGDFLAAPPFTLADPWGEDDEVFAAAFERIVQAVERVAARLPGARP